MIVCIFCVIKVFCFFFLMANPFWLIYSLIVAICKYTFLSTLELQCSNKLSSQVLQIPQSFHKLMCRRERRTWKEKFVTERGTDVQYSLIFGFVFSHRLYSGISWG